MDFSLDYTLPVSINIILDVVVIVIALFCAWRGWRKGIIGGLCSILAIVVSFYGANLIASTYSAEFTGIVEPFAHGIVDTMVNKVIGAAEDDAQAETSEEASDAAEDESGEGTSVQRPLVVVLSEEEKQDVYSVAFAVLRQVGFHEDTAANVAQKAVEVADFVGSDLSEFLAEQLCGVVAYIGVFVIAFILIAIIFVVIGNVLDLVFNLPGIELVNRILGLALGLGLAFCILQFIGCIARFTGIIISDETIESTKLFKYFVENNYLAAFIGL